MKSSLFGTAGRMALHMPSLLRLTLESACGSTANAVGGGGGGDDGSVRGVWVRRTVLEHCRLPPSQGGHAVLPETLLRNHQPLSEDHEINEKGSVSYRSSWNPSSCHVWAYVLKKKNKKKKKEMRKEKMFF